MEVSSDSGFRQFHDEGVSGGLCASCRYLRGTKHGEGREGASPEMRQKKTKRPPTCQQWQSERPIDSAPSREIPIILKAFVSTASS